MRGRLDVIGSERWILEKTGDVLLRPLTALKFSSHLRSSSPNSVNSVDGKKAPGRMLAPMKSVGPLFRPGSLKAPPGQNLELVGPPLRHVVAPVVDRLPTYAELASELRRGPKMFNGFLSTHAAECKACLTAGSSIPYGIGATVRTQMRTRLKTWNDRLNWALHDRRISKAELARACGVERASVTDWTNGKTKDPKLVPFFKACDALQVRPRWLALGEYPIDLLLADRVPYPRESVLETVTRLAEQLSVAEQRSVLNILQNGA